MKMQKVTESQYPIPKSNFFFKGIHKIKQQSSTYSKTPLNLSLKIFTLEREREREREGGRERGREKLTKSALARTLALFAPAIAHTYEVKKYHCDSYSQKLCSQNLNDEVAC